MSNNGKNAESKINERALKRRETRHPFFTDANDPFFSQYKKINNKEINVEYGDKFALKELAADLFVMPKVLFAFNEKGEIISGKVPTEGKTILKFNRGSNSFGIKIMNVKKITKRILFKFVSKNLKIGDNQEQFGPQYSFYPKRFFAEEFIEEFSQHHEYKIFVFKKELLIEENTIKAKSLNKPIILNLYNENGKPVLHPISLSKDSMELEKKVLINVRKNKEKIIELSRRVGGFCRVDLFFIGDNTYLNEVTLPPGEFRWYDKEVFEWSKSCHKKLRVPMPYRDIEDVDISEIKKMIARF